MIQVLSFLLGMSLGLGLILAIEAAVHMHVFGRWLRDSEIDKFFERHPLDNYELVEIDRKKRMLYAFKRPYLATAHSALATWTIQGVGTVPRWSKWNRTLNEYRGKLIGDQVEDPNV